MNKRTKTIAKTIENRPLDRFCRISQKVFFWLFASGFIVCTPVIVLFSLGYDFDRESKTFSKTGAIEFVTQPEDACITIDGKLLQNKTPHTERDMLPKEHIILIEKEGYFPYKTSVDVKSAMVSEFDIVLIPDSKTHKKEKLPFQVFTYFTVKRIMDERLICFTDKGVYVCDDAFNIEKQISSEVLQEGTAVQLKNIWYTNDLLMFWSEKQLWAVSSDIKEDEILPDINNVYTAKEVIQQVYVGLDKRYCIVQDGKSIQAVDVQNSRMVFQIATLMTTAGKVYYSEDDDILYVLEKDEVGPGMSVNVKNLGSNFISKFQETENERNGNKKNS